MYSAYSARKGLEIHRIRWGNGQEQYGSAMRRDGSSTLARGERSHRVPLEAKPGAEGREEVLAKANQRCERSVW